MDTEKHPEAAKLESSQGPTDGALDFSNARDHTETNS